MTTPIYNPPVPYVGSIPSSGLEAGQMIRIHGQVSPYPKCFAVNLQLGPGVNPRSDIALHLSPVFNPPPRVVRNNLTYLEWGAEESHGGFPFVAGQPFEIIILIQADCYKIAINGHHFTEFRHRVSPRQVSHLTVDGDVTIQGIIYETHNNQSSSGAPPMHHSSAPSYPAGPSTGMPPYPMGGGAVPYPPTAGPSGYPPQQGYVPQATGGYPSGYPTQSGPYPTQSGPYPSQQGYPTQQGYPAGPYPGGYPAQGGYATGGYPTGGYPGQNYPSSSKGILGGLGGGMFGNKSHKSGGITPGGVAGIAAGVGAAALGASMLSHAVPKLKMKKVFKGPKFMKHKGWGHKGWGHKGWGHKGWGKKGGFGGGFGKFKHKGW